MKLFTIPNLYVEHKEHKSFRESLIWMFQSGVGSVKLLFMFRKIRLPDTIHFIIIASLIVICFYSIELSILTLLVELTTVSFVHLISKFKDRNLTLLKAMFCHLLLILLYLIGRTWGVFYYLSVGISKRFKYT